MPIRYKKKSRHYRASRHNGYGIQGQNRKKGLKGGFGKTGMGKHKWTLITARGLHVKGPNRYFGKYGFKRPKCVVEEDTPINIKQLEQLIQGWVKEGKATKKGKTYSVDLGALGYTKLLGTGKATLKCNVTVKSASASAIEKIENAGGSVVMGEASTPAADA